MVDALREAHRVLAPSGVLIDVHPVTAPIVLEVVVAAQAVWAQKVDTFSAPDDVSAADAAIRHAVSRQWLTCQATQSFDFEIYCDTAAELSDYAAARKLSGAEIPYEELEERRRECGVKGQTARLRCRRPWMLAVYRSK